MRYQGAKARQEEEDQERNQDLAKSERRAQCGRAVGRCKGQPKQNAFIDIRICQQHRL